MAFLLLMLRLRSRVKHKTVIGSTYLTAAATIKRARRSRATGSSSPSDDALEAGLPTESNWFALPITLTKTDPQSDPVHCSGSHGGMI